MPIGGQTGTHGRPRPQRTGWVWGRIAAAIAGITALDLYTRVRLSRDTQDGAREEAMHAKTAVTIRHPVEVVYGYWRDFSNLPSFMNHLESVETTGNGRSHWTANAPAGRTVEWDAEIVEDKPNERIAWRSLEGSQVPNSGARPTWRSGRSPTRRS